MRKNLLINFLTGIVVAFSLITCTTNGISPAKGGDLPTNYIIVKDSSFSPSTLTVVSGSSITFVNNTAIAHSIATDDGATMPVIVIEPGKSFFFKKDTSGVFPYHCTTHPSAMGTIIITP
jgi:plastocyanin